MQGKAWISDEELYTFHCTFKDSVREGEGRVYYNGCLSFYGQYRNNEREGRGVRIKSNGEIFDGEWEKSLMKEGILTKPDQTKYKQVFDWESDKNNIDMWWDQ